MRYFAYSQLRTVHYLFKSLTDRSLFALLGTLCYMERMIYGRTLMSFMLMANHVWVLYKN